MIWELKGYKVNVRTQNKIPFEYPCYPKSTLILKNTRAVRNCISSIEKVILPCRTQIKKRQQGIEEQWSHYKILDN